MPKLPAGGKVLQVAKSREGGPIGHAVKLGAPLAPPSSVEKPVPEDSEGRPEQGIAGFQVAVRAVTPDGTGYEAVFECIFPADAEISGIEWRRGGP